MRNDLNAIICRLEDLSNNLQTPAELHPHADLDPADNPASALICLRSLMAALLGGAAPAGTHEEAWKRGCSSVTGWSFTVSRLSAEIKLNRSAPLRFLSSEFSQTSVKPQKTDGRCLLAASVKPEYIWGLPIVISWLLQNLWTDVIHKSLK